MGEEEHKYMTTTKTVTGCEKGIYKHWKGNEYELLFTGLFERDMTEVAIYKGEDGRIWVRDIHEFKERFTFIKSVELPSLFDFKIRRIKLGMTLRQVEELTGISNAYLSQLENGKIKKPSFDVVEKLNKLYGKY